MIYRTFGCEDQNLVTIVSHPWMGAHCLYLYFVAKMVELIITSGCIIEIQSTSPNSRSYPWNIQCLSPKHFKNPIHISLHLWKFQHPCDYRWRLVSWSQSYLPINPGPYIYPVVPGIVCHHASWSPCAKVQPGPFEHFPSCQNLQRSFFLSDDGRRFASIHSPGCSSFYLRLVPCFEIGVWCKGWGFLTIDSTKN